MEEEGGWGEAAEAAGAAIAAWEEEAAGAAEQEALSAEVARREAELGGFIGRAKGPPQRSPDWYGAMGGTVGGSELAAVLGQSPYGNFYSVAANKVAIRRGTAPAWTGSVACWWGTLFEDVVAEVVAADLGGRVQGENICIQAFPGHRNSPDGYIVVRVVEAPGGCALWRGARPPPPGATAKTALLEFKCPLSRRPAGSVVPRQYIPQLWSGLAVSPVADFGIYVDAVFRRCRVVDLGPSTVHDTAFHDRGRPFAAGPFAWGALAVYAPPGPLGASRGEEWTARREAGEEAAAAAEAEAAEESAAGAARLCEAGGGAPIDFGAIPPAAFIDALGLIDRRRLAVERLPPVFHDGGGGGGGGADYRGGEGEAWALAEAEARAPPGHRLLGLLPWKLFELHYRPIAPHPAFEAEILPRVAELHRVVDAALADPDPDAFLAAHARRACAGGGGEGDEAREEAREARAAADAREEEDVLAELNVLLA